MAVFGSGINPALGRTDYSAIQQGANAAAQGILAGGQGIARGIEQAGGAIAKGVERWDAIQKENKQKEAVVKDSIKFISTLQKLPGISDDVKQMSGSVLETLISGSESLDTKFTAAQGASGKLNLLLGLGQQAAENQQRERALKIQEKEVNARLSQMFQKNQQEAPQGYMWTPEGKLSAIPGGPQDPNTVGTPSWSTTKQREEEAAKSTAQSLETISKKEEQTDKYLKRATSTRRDLNNTLATINESIDLVRRGAGGPIEGLAPVRETSSALGGIAAALGVPGAAGAARAKILNSKYNSLRSSFKLEKMAELKENSPTGATGFGNQSDAEGRSLESSFVELDAGLPEDIQLSNLLKSKERVQSLIGALDSDLKTIGAKNTIGRFTIVRE